MAVRVSGLSHRMTMSDNFHGLFVRGYEPRATFRRRYAQMRFERPAFQSGVRSRWTHRDSNPQPFSMKLQQKQVHAVGL